MSPDPAAARWRIPLRDGPGTGDRRSWATRAATLTIWGAFIVFPVVNAATAGGGGARYWLGLLGAVVFSGSYVWLVMIWANLRRTPLEAVLTLITLMVAVALTLGIAAGWGFMFSYVGACIALTVPSPAGVGAVVATSGVAYAASVAAGAGGGTAIGYATSTLGVGLLLSLMREMRLRNVELAQARAELARTAVVAERERFARDLHDLLGHSLSVIAIKAELAGRLLPGEPERAAAEVADLESVARTALGEVRDAVSGYRMPTLEGELEGARVALAAAGIVAEFQRAPVRLSPEVEAVLAWAIREGATNVIRHSAARRCAVSVRSEADGTWVEVVDDGRAGPSVATGTGIAAGNGLAGLRERAAAVRGHLEAGELAGGGYRLMVTVPSVPVAAGEVRS